MDKQHGIEALNTGNNPPARKRGFWLTVYLIFLMLVNSLLAFTYLNPSPELLESSSKMTPTMLHLIGVLGLVTIILAIGIWRWKKLAVYGFFIVVVLAFIINNVYLGINSLSGLLGALLVYVTTKKRWEYFS